METDRNDEHFEVVLGRLDSLIRQGQPVSPPPPPPSVSEVTIPVLTEVYQGAVSAPEVGALLPEGKAAEPAGVTGLSQQEKLDQAVAAVLPMLAEVLEEELVMRVQPALERALGQVLENLRPQIEVILRQHMHAELAREQENQTET